MRKNLNSSPKYSVEDIKMYKKNVEEILISGQLILGKYTSQLEDLFCKISNQKYAVAVSSATAALEIILKHLNINGKKVIVPANTFVSTLYAIKNAGGTPKFIDIDESSLSINIEMLEDCIDDQTSVIIITHIAGLMCDEMNELKSICEEKKVHLIEDCSHAVGAKLDNNPSGSFGYASVFSLYPTKIVTGGTGGVLVTNDYSLLQKSKLMRTHGINLRSECEELSSDWILSEFNALSAVLQIEKLDFIIKKRNIIANKYKHYINKYDIPCEIQDNNSPTPKINSYYKFIIKFSEKYDVNLIIKKLNSLDIGVGKCYPITTNKHPYPNNVYSSEYFPNAERFVKNHIALPINIEMNEQDTEYIIRSINNNI